MTVPRIGDYLAEWPEGVHPYGEAARCPFCGAEQEFTEFYYNGPGSPPSYLYACGMCGVQGPHGMGRERDDHVGAREDAVRQWNRRDGMDADAAARIAALQAVIDTPIVAAFAEGVTMEAAHQRLRWGADHDAGKGPLDWFWLIGYLAQKATAAAIAGDRDKALHHTISTAAALANWHAALLGLDSGMRPGIDPAAQGIEP